MGTCNIDHSQEDVVEKLQSQESFLPVDLFQTLYAILKEKQSQETLNELFHLLKKYDLASHVEQQERNEKLTTYTN